MAQNKKHKVIEVKLRNGIEGLFVNVPDATVMSMQFNFRAGHYLANPEKWEIPHVMEHLSLGANKKYRKARLFEAELRKNGAYTNASTSNYSVTYEAECADFEWERVTDLMLTAISEPLFQQEEFEAEIGNVRDELMGRSNNHFRTLAVAASGEFGLLSLADRKRVAQLPNINIEDIKRFYKKTHKTGNLRFVIAGKLHGRMNSIKSKLENIALEVSSERLNLPEETPVKFKKPLIVKNKEVPNLYFDITSFYKGRFDDDEWDAAGLVNNILTETLYSKILGEAREKGLVYHLSSNFEIIRDYVAWSIGGQILHENLFPLLDIAIREVSKVKNGDISEEDIESAKQYSLGRFQLGAQTVYGIMQGYAGRYFFEHKVNDYYAFPERIKTVKKSQLQDVMYKLFSEDIWGIAMLGQAEKDFMNSFQNKLEPLWQRNQN